MKIVSFVIQISLAIFLVSIGQGSEYGSKADARPFISAGAPTAGVDEIQTLTIGGTPTSGTITVSFEGETSAPITWSATNATLLTNINAALDAMNIFEDGEVVATADSLTSGVGTISLTFGGNRSDLAVPLISVASNDLVGTSPTAAITEDTAGVTATARGAAKGRLLIDTTNADLYINNGTPLAPDWVLVGPPA